MKLAGKRDASELRGELQEAGGVNTKSSQVTLHCLEGVGIDEFSQLSVTSAGVQQVKDGHYVRLLLDSGVIFRCTILKGHLFDKGVEVSSGTPGAVEQINDVVEDFSVVISAEQNEYKQLLKRRFVEQALDSSVELSAVDVGDCCADVTVFTHPGGALGDELINGHGLEHGQKFGLIGRLPLDACAQQTQADDSEN
jgi:hypothetical protein